MKVTINAKEYEVAGANISHDQICEIVGQPVYASVTYRGPRNGDSQRSGTTHTGQTVALEDGMIFDCIVTGNA